MKLMTIVMMMVIMTMRKRRIKHMAGEGDDYEKITERANENLLEIEDWH